MITASAYAPCRPLPDRLADRFVTLEPDDDTQAFAEAEQHAPQPRLRWLTRAAMRPFASDFSINALLNTYPLFLLSTPQWRQLLGNDGGSLLDIGAATGDVTARLAPLFDDVLAVEVSGPMVRRLRERGLDARRLDLTRRPAEPGSPEHGGYDTVAILNVLDRCARPVSLLRSAISRVRPGGRLLVSMPLPTSSCWYDGPRLRAPLESLGIDATTWATGATALADVLQAYGLRVDALARAPYLSGGDRRQALYALDTAVLVASKPANARAAGAGGPVRTRR